MLTFYRWLELLNEERRRAVAPEVLQSSDLALLLQLEKIAKGIPDPQLRSKFLTMLRCPIVDSKNGCRYPAEYLLAALERNGIHDRYDIEAAIQYVFEKMLLPRANTEAGANIFPGFDPTRPDSVEHFRARFLSYVKFAVRNIKKGKIRRLANVEQRPEGTVSIGQGRQQEGEPGGTLDRHEGQPVGSVPGVGIAG